MKVSFSSSVKFEVDFEFSMMAVGLDVSAKTLSILLQKS
jgi:hypothetical protein